jgi:tape measure domain-containing protein
MTTERVQIIVTQSGAVRVKKELGEIGPTAQRSAKGIDVLKTAISAISLVAITRQLIDFADAGTQLQNRITLANESVKGMNVTTDELFAIAKRTRAPVEELATVFQRGALAANELGASQDELLRFTEGVGQALAIQGTSATQARGALLQLSQALGSSVVRAEEFNSLLEGGLPILQAVAAGIDGTGGSVSKLRELVLAGEITNKQFFNAFLSQTDELQRKFDLTVGTISQAFTNLRTSLIQATLNSETFRVVMQGAASAILFIADNINFFLPIFAALIAAVTLFAGAAVLGAMISGIQAGVAAFAAFNAVLLANPLILVGTLIAGLILYLVTMTDTVQVLTDAWNAMVQFFGDGINSILEWIGNWYDYFAGKIGQVRDLWNFAVASMQDAFAVFGQFISERVQFVADFFANAWQSAVNFVIGIWERMRSVAQSIFDAIAGYIQRVIDLIRSVTGAIGGLGGIGDFGGGIAPTSTGNGPFGPNGPTLDGVNRGGDGVVTTGAYRTGGSFQVGGVGGEDSQTARLRLTPGERVTIESPSQVRRGGGGAAPNVNMQQKIVNVIDPNAVVAAMKTKAGENIVRNVITANADEFAAVLGAAG